MSTNEKFEQLISNLMNAIIGIKAVAVVDHDGLIITSKLKDPNAEDDIIGTVTAVFDNVISRVKKDFGSAEDFQNIMTVDNQKFVFVGAGSAAILTIIAEPNSNDNRLKVYGSHVAQKVKQVLNQEDVDTSIPPIVDVLANMRTGTLPKGDFSIKVIIVGDPQVGKTSLIRRFVENKFAESYISTIGVDILKEKLTLSSNCTVNLSIWDIGGQAQAMAPYRKRFYQGANIVFFVFDITRKKTFNNLQKWIDDLKAGIGKRIPIILLSNKMDLTERDVNEEEIKAKADELNCPYILTSAKTGNNVSEAFKYAAYKFLQGI